MFFIRFAAAVVCKPFKPVPSPAGGLTASSADGRLRDVGNTTEEEEAAAAVIAEVVRGGVILSALLGGIA